jgi:hypothetical protein
LDLARRIAYKSRNNQRLKSWGRILALMVVVMGGLDLVSTNAALASGHLEGNPLLRSMQVDLGFWWSLPKMAFHLALAYLVLWIPSKRMLATGTISTWRAGRSRPRLGRSRSPRTVIIARASGSGRRR